MAFKSEITRVFLSSSSLQTWSLVSKYLVFYLNLRLKSDSCFYASFSFVIVCKRVFYHPYVCYIPRILKIPWIVVSNILSLVSGLARIRLFQKFQDLFKVVLMVVNNSLGSTVYDSALCSKLDSCSQRVFKVSAKGLILDI